MEARKEFRRVASLAALLAAAGCASTTPPPAAPAAPQVLPHTAAPEAKLDPVACPVIVFNGPQSVQYPQKAFEIGQEGWTRYRFDIDDKGKAANLRLVGSSPAGVFDDAARATIEQAQFLSAKEKDCELVFAYRKDAPK